MVLTSSHRSQNSLYLQLRGRFHPKESFSPLKDVHFLFFQNYLVNSDKFLPARGVAEIAGGQHKLLGDIYIFIN